MSVSPKHLSNWKPRPGMTRKIHSTHQPLVYTCSSTCSMSFLIFGCSCVRCHGPWVVFIGIRPFEPHRMRPSIDASVPGVRFHRRTRRQAASDEQVSGVRHSSLRNSMSFVTYFGTPNHANPHQSPCIIDAFVHFK